MTAVSDSKLERESQTAEPSRFDRSDIFAIGSILAIAGLVYGIWLSRLGFYWDDWPVIWVYHSLGRSGLIRYFAEERPVAGLMYAFLAPILGISPIGWQIVAFLVRFASTVAIYLGFRMLWPIRRDLAWLTAVIVLLYPGFSEQAIALNFLEQNLSFLLFSISFAATLRANSRPTHRLAFILLAFISGLFSYLITEFFVALELFRVAAIGILVRRDGATNWQQFFRKTLLLWSPYAAMWGIYVCWRSFFVRLAPQFAYTDVRSQLAQVQAHPVHQFVARIEVIFQNIAMSTVVAWARPFTQEVVSFERQSMPSWIIGLLIGSICVIMLRKFCLVHSGGDSSNGSGAKSEHLLGECVMLSMAGLLVAGLPYAVSMLKIEYSGHEPFTDRFSLSFMLPASLALVCLVQICRDGRARRGVAAALILMFSIFQFQNELAYRQDWLRQRSTFWQIKWRFPQLKQQTAVFMSGLPATLFRNHTAGMLNMLYEQDDRSGHLDYFIFDLAELTQEGLPQADGGLSYMNGAPIVGRLRSFKFSGSTSQSIVSWIAPDGIWRIIYKPYRDEELGSSAAALNVSGISNPSAVISDAPASASGDLLQIYGAESTAQWAYYYQTAQLDRQLARWSQIAALSDEAKSKGYSPEDLSEYFPFIEGYAMAGRYQDATTLTRFVLLRRPDAVGPLSSLWSRVKSTGERNQSEELQGALHDLSTELNLESRAQN